MQKPLSNLADFLQHWFRQLMKSTSYTPWHILLSCTHDTIVFYFFFSAKLRSFLQYITQHFTWKCSHSGNTMHKVMFNSPFQINFKKNWQKNPPGPDMQSCTEDLDARSNIYGMLISKLKLISKLGLQKKEPSKNLEATSLIELQMCLCCTVMWAESMSTGQDGLTRGITNNKSQWPNTNILRQRC